MSSRKNIAVVTVIAALTAMALVGASTASATSTQLCHTHKGLTCEGGTAVLNLANEGIVSFLNSIADVLCLSVTATLIALDLGNPQAIHTLGMGFSNCGTTSSHNNCKLTVDEMPGWNLLKSGLDQGSLTATNGEVRVVCDDVTIFKIDLDCKYNITGLELPAGGQHVTANESLVELEEGTAFCPEETFLDALLKTTKASTEPSLCKVHTNICKTADLVNSIDMTTTAAPVLLNGVANVECKSSLLASGVTDPMLPEKPISLNVTSLTWNECKASGNSCTVTSKALPTFALSRTALNLGQATASSGLEISVVCAGLGLECVFGGGATLSFEGALHTGGAGHGKFTASGATLNKLQGGGNCPASVSWDASYELPEHTYLGPALEGGSAYILA